jgi:hypothetical protein
MSAVGTGTLTGARTLPATRALTATELWLTALVVGMVAVAVRVVAAGVVPFPIPEDTAYYYGVARNLLEGRGLISDAAWSFQTPPLTLPRPAFEVWLPLPSFLAAIPMAVLGITFSASQVMPILVGALVPVLAWRLALDVALERSLPVNRARVLSVGAGLTAAVELPLLLHSTLPDSTALFAVLTLAACLLMTRILARPRGATWAQAWRDPRLLALGAAIGLSALTRNEAIWLAGTWALLLAWVWWRGRRREPIAAADSFDDELRRRNISGATGRRDLLRLLLVPAIVSFAIFLPWAIRNWLAFGSPLPGQAITNAFSVSGLDIFAYQDPPTLSSYLAQGPVALIQMRIDGFVHNLFSVLLIPSFPVGLIGLVALPWQGRGPSLRPLLVVSLVTFAATTLLFPISTTWGTYLHASGAAHVLLLVSCLFALDALIVRVGKFRGWTRPVAWLGPALTISGSIVFSLFFLPGFGAQARDVQTRYTALAAELTKAGIHVADMGPVISTNPIWWAEAERGLGVGLPNEPPPSILALAQQFPGTHYLITNNDHGIWPAVIDSNDPLAHCFQEIVLGTPSDPAAAATLANTRVFELVCP